MLLVAQGGALLFFVHINPLTSYWGRYSVSFVTESSCNRRQLNFSLLTLVSNDFFFLPDQIESNCRRQIKCCKNIFSVFDRIENIVGKGENAGHQHFLLFPQCFQMASSTGSLKEIKLVGCMVFNAVFNSISVISRRPCFLEFL